MQEIHNRLNIFNQIQDEFDSVLKIIWLRLLRNLILLAILKFIETVTYRLFNINITTALQRRFRLKRILN
jgi:hypothetical protein